MFLQNATDGAPRAIAAENTVDGTALSQRLLPRTELLRELNLARQDRLPERRVFLFVINIADTKHYDDVIRIFGYKFADDLLNIRLTDLDFISNRQPLFHVGFWSVGFLLRARDAEEYEAILARLNQVLAAAVICRGIPVTIQAGVGVCDLAQGLGSAEDLLQATYLAGQAGAASRAGWSECNYELAEDHRRAFAVISHAGYSLSTPDQFELSYQARLDLKSGRCLAAEALLRWYHPTLGLVMPSEFVPLIEMTGLMHDLTDWVLTRALSDVARWHGMGIKLKACVNISIKDLDDADFCTRLARLLEAAKLAPQFLELQFTEDASPSLLPIVRQTLREVRALGVDVALDNFGAGANSLSWLGQIPANVLKIDRAMINGITDRPKQQGLVKSIIRLGHELNMQVVAEGLETAAQMEMLAGWGCDAIAGYFINRPLPGDAFIDWYGGRFARP